jgi:predicted acetyltransferase
MELTYAETQVDLEQIADLVARVFVRKSYFDIYRDRMNYQTSDPYFKPEHSRVIKEDGQIVSHVSIVEKHMRIGRSLVKVAGIGDVCTHPRHRGKSYCRILMEDAIRYMQHNGYPLSMLYGIPAYYHKFGYIESMGTYSAYLKVKPLLELPVKHTLRPCKAEDTGILNDLYNAAYNKKTGSMKRVVTHWYKLQDPKRVLIATGKSGEIIGYAISSLEGFQPFFVQEAVMDEYGVGRSFLGHYAKEADKREQTELELRLYPTHPLVLLAETLGGRFEARYKREGEGHAMLRIINLHDTLAAIVEELQGRLDASSLGIKNLSFRIKTDQAGQADLLIQDGRLRIEKDLCPQKTVWEVAQNMLTRLIVGYHSLEQVRMRNPELKVPGDLADVLSVLFPRQEPVTCEGDYF